jgi:hypothetical protein
MTTPRDPVEDAAAIAQSYIEDFRDAEVSTMHQILEADRGDVDVDATRLAIDNLAILLQRATAPLPAGWRDLIEGLLLLAKHHTDEESPLHCTHDTLTVMAAAEKFTADERNLLDELGFHPNADGGIQSFRFGSA